MPLRAQGQPIPVAAAAPAGPPAQPPPGAGGMNVPFFAQEQTNWCWAAVSQMVFRYYGTNALTQCELATWRFGAACCSTPWSSVCNAPSWPHPVWANWGITSAYTASAVAYATLQFEITGARPVCVYLAWSQGGSHVALVTGWYDNTDVYVADPYYGPGRVSFSDLVAGYGLGSWAGTYTNIRP